MAGVSSEKRSSQRFRETKRFKDAARALGARARELRESHELTLEQASAQMEVDLKHLQKVEAGQLNVTLVTVLRIADGLNVSPSALFDSIGPIKRRRPRGPSKEG
jgi:transcriptional regulator with XRE-family HTH domain